MTLEEIIPVAIGVGMILRVVAAGIAQVWGFIFGSVERM